MSNNKNRRIYRRNDKPKPCLGEAGREVLGNIDESSPVLQSFRQYAAEIDDKHDRYERIVKIGRDITIESKRIIFLLHTLDREEKRSAILKEAEDRLNGICQLQFKNIAKELKGRDPYQYTRAYTAGLQEFIEALTFFQYLQDGTFENWIDIQKRLSYTEDEIQNVVDTRKLKRLSKGDKEDEEQISLNKARDTSDEKIVDITNSEYVLNDIKEAKPQEKTVFAFLSPVDYILGLGDLTGEIMRKCINSLGAGDINACFEACEFVRDMNRGFLSIPPAGLKEISKKAYTLRQSVLKAEMVCYNIKVRGGESSTWGLMENSSRNIDDVEDEGFY